MTNITALTSAYFDRLLPTALGFENSFAALDNAAHLLTAKSANAKGFKIIVPISGNNQP